MRGVDSLVLPLAKDIVAATCPKDSVGNGQGMIHGWLRDERARPVAHGTVTVNWQANFEMVAGSKLSYMTRTIGAVTDNGGYWRACGVPVMATLSVSIASDSGSDSRDVRLEDGPFAEVNLVLHKVSAASKDLSLGIRAPRPRAQVELDIAGHARDPARRRNARDPPHGRHSDHRRHGAERPCDRPLMCHRA